MLPSAGKVQSGKMSIIATARKTAIGPSRLIVVSLIVESEPRIWGLEIDCGEHLKRPSFSRFRYIRCRSSNSHMVDLWAEIETSSSLWRRDSVSESIIAPILFSNHVSKFRIFRLGAE